MMFNTKIDVFIKTGYRCSICGTYDKVKIGYFIPVWTRVGHSDIRNKIPICENCSRKRGFEFIELGKLQYLPTTYVNDLMEFYSEYKKYLRKYVMDFGNYRTEGSLDIDHSILCMKSYDYKIDEMKKGDKQ